MKTNLLFKIFGAYADAKYKFGFTHQFSCKQCGAPIDEEPAVTSFPNMWDWRCEFCGWKMSGGKGGHAPKIMKPQHMRVVAVRKWLWALRHWE